MYGMMGDQSDEEDTVYGEMGEQSDEEPDRSDEEDENIATSDDDNDDESDDGSNEIIGRCNIRSFTTFVFYQQNIAWSTSMFEYCKF